MSKEEILTEVLKRTLQGFHSQPVSTFISTCLTPFPPWQFITVKSSSSSRVLQLEAKALCGVNGVIFSVQLDSSEFLFYLSPVCPGAIQACNSTMWHEIIPSDTLINPNITVSVFILCLHVDNRDTTGADDTTGSSAGWLVHTVGVHSKEKHEDHEEDPLQR